MAFRAERIIPVRAPITIPAITAPIIIPGIRGTHRGGPMEMTTPVKVAVMIFPTVGEVSFRDLEINR